MWLEAILTKDDIRDIFAQFTPFEIRLGENGRLLLASPTEISMIPDEGVSVVCEATIHWPVLGFDVPVHMHGLTVLIHPMVRPDADGRYGILAFTLQIDHAGVSLLPAVIDDHVRSLLNRELEEKHVELAWNFGNTLSHVFNLPAALASAAALSLKVGLGTVKVTDQAIGFAVEFGAEVQPRVGTLDRRSA
jgi:hypothetical protein